MYRSWRRISWRIYRKLFWSNPAAPFLNAGSGGGGGDLLGGPYSKLRDGSAGHFGHFSAQTLPSDEAWIATKEGTGMMEES